MVPAEYCGRCFSSNSGLATGEVQVSSFAYDIFVTAVFMPLPLVPVAGVCTLGMLRMQAGVLFGVFVPMVSAGIGLS